MPPSSRHRPTGKLRFSDGSKSSTRGAVRELGARALTFAYRRMLFMAYPLDGVRIPVYNAAIDVTFGMLQKQMGIITPILVGPAAKISSVARAARLNIERFEIVDVPHSDAAAAKAVELTLVRQDIDSLNAASG